MAVLLRNRRPWSSAVAVWQKPPPPWFRRIPGRSIQRRERLQRLRRSTWRILCSVSVGIPGVVPHLSPPVVAISRTRLILGESAIHSPDRPGRPRSREFPNLQNPPATRPVYSGRNWSVLPRRVRQVAPTHLPGCGTAARTATPRRSHLSPLPAPFAGSCPPIAMPTPDDRGADDGGTVVRCLTG